MSHPSPCEQSGCFSLSCSAFLFCAMNLHFLVCLIPARFFCCCCYFNMKSLWLVKEAEREDALQLLPCFQHPCGGIGPSENQLLTCSEFLFTDIHKKAKIPHFTASPLTQFLKIFLFTSNHPHIHPHPAGKPLLQFCTDSHSIQP